MRSPKTKRYILQILPFALISMIFSVIYGLLEKGILGTHPIYPSTGNPYNFNLIVPSFSALIIGFAIGALEIFYFSKWFQKDTFSKKILLKTTLYLVLIIIFILLITSISTGYELGLNPLHPQVWVYNFNFVFSLAFVSILIYMGAGILVGLFYTEVSNTIGQSVLLNFFSGKYHHPKEEERIFMFADMKSSTTIAEQLGHIRYFDLLKEYYSDLSEAIMNSGGEIYQYVGDEVVVTWRLRKNKVDCIECFFEMKKNLQQQATKCQSIYGVVPTFKAGMHIGQVTTGEIGVIKKDIVFSGDVLNTTARIQGLCNAHQVDLLVSDELIKRLELGKEYQVKVLESVSLRGRVAKIDLYSVEKSTL